MRHNYKIICYRNIDNDNEREQEKKKQKCVIFNSYLLFCILFFGHFPSEVVLNKILHLKFLLFFPFKINSKTIEILFAISLLQ